MAVKTNGTKGNDVIFVDTGVDIVSTGAGDDIIYTGAGNDIITGGKGKNTVVLTNFLKASDFGPEFESILGGDFGNDVINLSKDEKLILDCKDYSDFSAKIEGKNVLLTFVDNLGEEKETVTLKNFASKDIVGSKGSVSLKLKGSDELIDLKEYFYATIPSFNKKGEYKGSWLDEEISAEGMGAYDKKGEKGVTVKAGGGDDEIIGSSFKDTIYGGDGVDTINGGIGDDKIYGDKGDDILNGDDGKDTLYGGDGDDVITGDIGDDIITGGKGQNTIVFEEGFGADVINLTKGEDVILDCKDFDSVATAEIVGKNVVITFETGDSITLKNLASKDLVTSSGSLMLQLYNQENNTALTPINLKDPKVFLYEAGLFNKKGEYKGSWLNEEISAEGMGAYDKKGEKGVTVKAGGGDDKITGSNFKDTIYGGDGEDVIEAGAGDDKIYGEAGKNVIVFNVDDGNDTVYSGKGEDTLEFNTNISDIVFEQVKNSKGVGTKDLIIYYGDSNDSVTVKNYFTVDKKGNITGVKSSVKNISTFEGIFNMEDARLGMVDGGNSGDGDGDDFGDNSGESSGRTILTDRITLSAGGGDDDLYSHTVNGIIYGGAGDDEIGSDGENNLIYGDAGNDYIYISGNNNIIHGGAGNDCFEVVDNGDPYEETENSVNTIVFNNGDGADTISSSGNDLNLKFNGSLFSGLSLAKLGSDLVIKYNFDKDSVTLFDYFDEERYEYEIAPKHTIVDKNGNEVLLSDFIDNYGYIPKLSITEIKGTDGADEIDLSVMDNTISIDTGKGKDYLYIEGLNYSEINTGSDGDEIFFDGVGNKIYAGSAGDYIGLTGNKNELYGGAGNDYISIFGYEDGDTNTIIFNDGDGNDIISENTSANIVLKFNDALMDDLQYVRVENDLVLRYNSGKDSVTISQYLNEEDYEYSSKACYMLEDKNGNQKSLSDEVASFGTIPEIEVSEINGTTESDQIFVPSYLEGAVVNAGAGDDYIDGADDSWIYGDVGNDEIVIYGDNNMIYGGAGNDEIVIYGDNNMIYGGVGNDYIDISGNGDSYGEGENPVNTIVFNNGDGVDTISSYETDLNLKFNDSLFSGLSLVKSGYDLVIKYNFDKDSVTISDYFKEETSEYEMVSRYTIVDKNGDELLLSDFVSSYGDIPNQELTNIKGTDGKDYISIENVSMDTIYSVQKDVNYTIDDVAGSDSLYLEDAVSSAMNIIFDIDKNYKASDGLNFGDIILLDDANIEKWAADEKYNSVIVKNNVIEVINCSDGYSITSEQIAQLAESVASWLGSKGYDSAQAVLDGENYEDICALVAMMGDDSNWCETAV